MGKVTILVWWVLHLSHSVYAGVYIVITTKKLCEMIVNLIVLVVNPFPQIRWKHCGGPSSSVLPIPSVLLVKESEYPDSTFCRISSNFICSFDFKCFLF